MATSESNNIDDGGQNTVLNNSLIDDICCGNLENNMNANLLNNKTSSSENLEATLISNETASMDPIEGDKSVKDENITTVQEFYRGTNIFVTGGTGFMGKVLIEKLLRSCPHLNRIYLLVRSKKGKTIEERIQEIFQDPFFDRLKKENPHFREKVRIISGDCSEPGLGLSVRDRKGIMEHVHIVFHVAATVRFDEKLATAIPTNIKGTRDLMILCKECRNIKAVMHVSTAYAHCYRQDIGEEFYDVPITSERAAKMADCINEGMLTTITPTVLGKWPNTYTFTKAVAEEAVRTHGKSIPVGVFRPSIIVCTRNEPIKGWIDNLYGPTGAVVGVGMGIIRTMQINDQARADLVPCDMVVNALITAAWDVHERRRCGKEDIPIYNYVSSWENPITWGEYISRTIKQSWKVPFNKSTWMVFIVPSKIRFLYKLYAFFLHIMPATMIDAILYVTGQKPMMLKTYDKIHRFSEVLAYFSTRQWKFRNRNVQKLWQKLSPEDKSIFDFNISTLHWDTYFHTSLMGIRTYLLKDDPKTLQNAIRRRFRLYWLHLFVKYVFLCLLLWLFWTIAKDVPFLSWSTGSSYFSRKSYAERIKASSGINNFGNLRRNHS